MASGVLPTGKLLVLGTRAAHRNGWARSGRLGDANPRSHVDACTDTLERGSRDLAERNEGLWSPVPSESGTYLTRTLV